MVRLQVDPDRVQAKKSADCGSTRQAIAPLAAVAVALILVGWILVEMVFLAGIGSLAWAFYLALGCGIAAVGIVWWRTSPSRRK